MRTNLQTTQDVLIEKSKSTSAIRKQISEVDSEIKRMDSEIYVMNDSISSKNTKIGGIERNKLDIASNSDLAKEVGPLKYIADLTGKSLDQVVNWYIIVLMLVFDPLAIALVIAANFAFEMGKDKEEKIKEEKVDNKKNRLKPLWSNLFKKSQKENEEILLNEEDLIDYKEAEENSDDILSVPEEEIVIDDINMPEENIVEDIKIIIEPESITPKEENVEDTENKVEDVDKYRDSNLSIEKQKMIRERFRNNPGSNPLKLR
jgi:hypothetical protein